MTSFDLVCIFLCATVTLCSADCGQLFARNVTDADKQFIVNKHNTLRGLISQGLVPHQPKGTNLKTLKWDDNLALDAQRIADTCIYGHAPTHDDRFPAVGQNIAARYWNQQLPKQYWDEVVQQWFDEYKVYTYPNDWDMNTGHYTQVVWADTYLIGCGFTWYSKQPSFYEQFYVCHYGPSGNYRGQAPYKID